MRGLVVLSLLFLASACQAQQSIAETGFSITMHVNGCEIRFWVLDTDLKDSPEWPDPDRTAPPLTIADAVAASKPELARYNVEHPEHWYVRSVTLHRLDKRPRWFYLVEWKSDQQKIGDGITIPLLMNGKAVVGELHRMKDDKISN